MAVFQYYTDKGGQWRWRLRNDEGNIIAVSGEGFDTKDECLADLNTAKELSEISEVRIYETEEDFIVHREAPEPVEEPLEESESDLDSKPEPEEEPEIEEEPGETKEVEDIIEEKLPEQPDDVPPLIRESSFTAEPEKWKRPNWALITSIGSVAIIIILIILLSLRDKSKPEPQDLQIISDIPEQVQPEPVPPSPPAEPVPVVEEESEATELETEVKSPELEKSPEPTPMDIYHTVVKGDRLWDLADDYYSDAFLWPNIYNANTSKIRNPDILRLGIELLIPALEGTYQKLSKNDRLKVADGYLHAYLIYKKLGKEDAKYYLWVAQLYDPSILAKYQGKIDLEDMQAIKSFKKR